MRPGNVRRYKAIDNFRKEGGAFIVVGISPVLKGCGDDEYHFYEEVSIDHDCMSRAAVFSRFFDGNGNVPTWRAQFADGR